jgi:hypothetical protein
MGWQKRVLSRLVFKYQGNDQKNRRHPREGGDPGLQDLLSMKAFEA